MVKITKSFDAPLFDSSDFDFDFDFGIISDFTLDFDKTVDIDLTAIPVVTGADFGTGFTNVVETDGASFGAVSLGFSASASGSGFSSVSGSLSAGVAPDGSTFSSGSVSAIGDNVSISAPFDFDFGF